jgi:hypothetical protein
MDTVLYVPLTLQRRGGRKLIIVPQDQAPGAQRSRPDPVIVRGLTQAFRWLRLIETGEVKCITAIARKEGLSETFVQRRLNLTCLSPRIIEAALDGTLPVGTKLSHLIRALDLSWNLQEERLGMERDGAAN